MSTISASRRFIDAEKSSIEKDLLNACSQIPIALKNCVYLRCNILKRVIMAQRSQKKRKSDPVPAAAAGSSDIDIFDDEEEREIVSSLASTNIHVSVAIPLVCHCFLLFAFHLSVSDRVLSVYCLAVLHFRHLCSHHVYNSLAMTGLKILYQ